MNKEKIEAGYRAYNGYIFTQVDVDFYNGYCKTENERHRVFQIICSQKPLVDMQIPYIVEAY